MKQSLAKESLVSADLARRMLAYNPTRGDFTWRVKSGPVVPGRVAGSRDTSQGQGYVKIAINKHDYKAHRLAWLMMTGEWPVHEVDHIDRDGFNNAWANLREATAAQNCANKRLRKDSSTGSTGVDVNRNRWRARITVNHRTVQLGSFGSRDEAEAAYARASAALHGEFSQLRTG